MTTSETFSVHFWLKKTAIKKDGTVPIYARITVDGNRADISVKESVKEKDWCPLARRIKTKSSGAKHINDTLGSIYSKLSDCYTKLKNNGVVISALTIKLRYLGKDKPIVTILDLMNYHRENDLVKLSSGTAKNYPSTEEYIRRYILKKYKSSDFNLKKVDYAFVIGFENYLRNCIPLRRSQPLSNNGIMKHMERFQKLTNLAVKHEWIKNNPFSLYQLKFEEFESPFLEQYEIDAIMSNILDKKSIRIVRDVFIFSCYTGLCYAEVKNLKDKNIVTGVDGEKWIMMRRQKTKTPVKVPLLDEAKEILASYKDYPFEDNEGKLLPVLSIQKTNKYLKVIANLCNIDKRLTFHVARHTFATTITLLNNVPISTVSKLLSHKKLSTTQKYARVIEKKISGDMRELKDKLRTNSKKKVISKQPRISHLRIV